MMLYQWIASKSPVVSRRQLRQDTQLEVTQKFTVHYIMDEHGQQYWEVHRESDGTVMDRLTGIEAATKMMDLREAGRTPNQPSVPLTLAPPLPLPYTPTPLP